MIFSSSKRYIIKQNSEGWNNVLTWVFTNFHGVLCTPSLADPCVTPGITVRLPDCIRRNEVHVCHVSMYRKYTIYLKRTSKARVFHVYSRDPVTAIVIIKEYVSFLPFNNRMIVSFYSKFRRHFKCEVVYFASYHQHYIFRCMRPMHKYWHPSMLKKKPFNHLTFFKQKLQPRMF